MLKKPETIYSQEELIDSLSNMIEHRIHDCESTEEITFCISDCLEEWQGIYKIKMTGE